jgi:hypothetical protein
MGRENFNQRLDSIRFGIVAGLMFGLAACNPPKFEGQSIVSQDIESSEVLSNYFKLSEVSFNQLQETLEENLTTLNFEVVDPGGNPVEGIRAPDLRLLEAGKPVSQFDLDSNSKKIVQTVDIVFAVDVTGSMTPTIESAKLRLINFIHRTRAAGHHTRMCLLTFGDYTVKACTRFYDNDPTKPETMTDVNTLISEITKLQALKGANDPGGYDLNENPMRALIDAAAAPFLSDSQRFAILITDDGFLYSAGNQGSVGNLAPRYNEVLQALDRSKIKVFAATPSLAGYNSNFQGQPSVVQASGGEHFLFSDLINGRITLDTILNRIIARVQVSYKISYTARETQGHQPNLPLPARQIELRLANGQSVFVRNLQIQSNLPNGRAEYKRKWRVSDKAAREGTLRVKLEGQELHRGFWFRDGEIEFELPPSPGAKLEVSYEPDKLKDALELTPMVLPGEMSPAGLDLELNGQMAKPGDVLFEKNLEGEWSVRLADRVLSEEDPYHIRGARGLTVRMFYEEPNENAIRH